MTSKDDARKKTRAFLSNSQEVFEKIFAQATRELKIGRKPKAAVQQPMAAPPPEAPRTGLKKPEVPTSDGKAVPTYKASEKVKASPQSKPKGKTRSRKGSRALRASLLFILLLVLAGLAANYFAPIDFSVIPDLMGLSPKPVVQAPIPRKQAAKPPEKPTVPLKQPQAQEKVPTTAPALSVSPPSVISKEEKLVQLETPTTIAQSAPAEERIGEKAPFVAPQARPSPPQAAVMEEPQPVPVQAQVPEKPSAPMVAPSKPLKPQYPYSVYLGSFKAAEAVSKALSGYHEKGISAYWARVDLGDKGVWFRFFAGYFRTKEEAEKYISDHNIPGATPRVTKYANLIGIYGSDKETEDQKRALLSAGFYPYVIKGADGKSLLYSGAFDRKEYAEKERAVLASKSIQSTVVDR
jgi:hypothetical protein